MSDITHCPYSQSTLLQQALAPNKMRIAFLLGAGCPVSIRVGGEKGSFGKPLVPDIAGLTKLINERLHASNQHKNSYERLLTRLPENSTIEEILSHLRSLSMVVRNGKIDDLDDCALKELDAEICKITTEVVGVELPESTPYHQLATWIGGIDRIYPIEIFSLNYDLLMEQAFEARKIPYFDGFVGSHHAFFDLASMEDEKLPNRWGRLWKLHGSVNWWRTKQDEVIRRTGDLGSGSDERQMIYPSHLKYDQSRRMPYLAMQDRLRAFLAGGQAILVTCGYSFQDQHLNEVILHGLRSNPTAICFGLLFGKKENYKHAHTMAQSHPNLSVLASDGAVLGTLEGGWKQERRTNHSLHGLAVNGTDNEDSDLAFLLGDFKSFGRFLARQLSRFDDEQGISNAP